MLGYTAAHTVAPLRSCQLAVNPTYEWRLFYLRLFRAARLKAFMPCVSHVTVPEQVG